MMTATYLGIECGRNFQGSNEGRNRLFYLRITFSAYIFLNLEKNL